MKKLFILFFLLPLFVKAQVYQAMPQAGYGPVKRMLFDSVLTLPLGIAKLQNISGGRDTGQIRYNKVDSSIYIYSGNSWRKIGGGDTTSLSNRIDAKLSSISAVSPITATTGITPVISTSMSTNKLIGRSTAGTGVMEQISVGSGLTLNGGILTNTATPTPIGYYGAFQDILTQTINTPNVGQPFLIRTVDESNQISITANGSGELTRITPANTGVYNIQWSGQFENKDNAIHDVNVWFKKGLVSNTNPGTDVIGSNGIIALPARKSAAAGEQGHTVAGWNFLLTIAAGEYVEFYWMTDNNLVSLKSYSAGNPPPSTASLIVTVTQQSGIMAGTGITAINSLTDASQTMVVGTDSSDFKIVSSGTQHKFNLPTASSTKRGALSSADWTTFNGKMNYSDTASLSNRINTKQNTITNPITGTGTTNYLSKFTSTSAIGNSLVFDNGTNVLVNTTTDNLTDKLQVNGSISASSFNPIAGTTSIAPIKLTAGTNLTTPAAGSMEYDATNNLLAFTSNSTSGRGIVPNFNSFLLRSNGSAITTIDNFFGANSNIPVTAGYYEIEVEMFFLKTTTSTITWTFTGSGGYGSAFDFIMSPAAGIPGSPNSSYLKISQIYTTGASFTITTAALTTGVNHYAKFKIFAVFPGITTLTIKVTSTSGSVTPLQMSNWKATKLPSTNIGTYAP